MAPTNPLVTALLTDLYQITMAYAHFKSKKHEEQSVFELFFRKNPFHGEFTIFAGLDEVVKHLETFSFLSHDTKDEPECFSKPPPCWAVGWFG